MKYTTEQLEAIAEKLRNMPLVEKSQQEHSKQGAVRVLSKEIAAMQKRGYTLEQISEALNEGGLVIATPTLKSYLQRAKTPRKATTKATTEKPVSSKKEATEVNKTKATFEPKTDTTDL